MHRVLMMVALLLLAGCESQGRDALRVPPTSSPTLAAGSPTVDLVVAQGWRAKGLLVEGGYSFVEVRTPAGIVVDRQIVANYVAGATTRWVMPGSYIVSVDIRGCPGWCPDDVAWNDSRLDEPAASCEEMVDVPAGPRFVVVLTVMSLDRPTRCTASVGG